MAMRTACHDDHPFPKALGSAVGYNPCPARPNITPRMIRIREAEPDMPVTTMGDPIWA